MVSDYNISIGLGIVPYQYLYDANQVISNIYDPVLDVSDKKISFDTRVMPRPVPDCRRRRGAMRRHPWIARLRESVLPRLLAHATDKVIGEVACNL